MSEQDYLTFLGYTPTTDWMVLKQEEYKHLLECQGHQNNMYGATDPKGVELFGKNAKVVKRAWYEQNTSHTKAEDSSPPPPPVPLAGPGPIVPAVEEKKSICELTNRLEALKEKGLTIDEENQDVIFPTGKVSFLDIKNYPENIWEKVLNKDYSKVAEVVKETPTVTYELSKDERVNLLASIGLSQKGNVYVDEDNTTAIEVLKVNTSSDQDLLKSFEAMKANLETIAAKKLKEAIVEKSGVSENNVIVGSVPKVEFKESEDPKAEPFDADKQKEIDSKIEETIEKSENTQELADNLEEEFSKDEVENVIEDIGEGKSAVGPGADEIAKAQKPAKLSAADKKLRDVFATEAMKALLNVNSDEIPFSSIAIQSYNMADAMLKNR